MATKRSLLSDQMDWYASQPVSYRRDWWAWAEDQPNFAAMAAWARRHEQDEAVLRMLGHSEERMNERHR